MAASALGIKANGARWMSSLTFTTRTVNDAEVFDVQAGAVARAGFLLATASRLQRARRCLGYLRLRTRGPGPGRDAATSHALPRSARRSASTACGSSTPAPSTPITPACTALEFGANWKSLYLQGEHFWYDVERRAPAKLPDPDFKGYYLQGSWILTGESRRYNAATGSFQNPRPMVPFSSNGGFGAWELAARYSRMDLNFDEGLAGTAAVPGSVRGGDQSDRHSRRQLVPNPNFKIMMNYMLIDVDRLNPAGPGNTQPFGPAPNTPPLGVEIGQDLDVFRCGRSSASSWS